MPTLTTFLGDATSVSRRLEEATVSASITCADGDVVQFFTVKKGWRIFDIKLDYTATAATTVKVGDGGDDDRFIVSTSTAASGQLEMNSITLAPGGVVSVGAGYTYTVDDTIDLTIAGAAVTAKVYTMTVIYTRTFD